MYALKPKYEALGYEIIYRRELKSLSKFFKNKNYIPFLIECMSRVISNIVFWYRVSFIRDSEILLIHPQTVGYPIFFKLVRRNAVRLYVMDNSFFCIRSYNCHPITGQECFSCIGKIDPDPLCTPFPPKVSRKKNCIYLEQFKKISNLISYYAQNELQADLLKMHFNANLNISTIGMKPVDADDMEYEGLINNKDPSISFDLVFHGAIHLAKGIGYFIELAIQLPEFKFFVPDNRDAVQKIIKYIAPNNVFFESMTWETGLKERVQGAKIVINPSLWSAPIEGALLKSAAHNTNVATVKTRYGYEGEIKSIKNHLRLDVDVKLAAIQIRNFLLKNQIQ